jgi:HEAT repeat protein
MKEMFMSSQEIPSLITELTCDDFITCQKARRSLVKIGHEAVPHLVQALGSRKEWVRWEAAKALGQIGDPSATEALIRALVDSQFDVRWLAAEGLIVIGRPSLVPLLKALIENPKSLELREGVHHVLHDMYRGELDSILKPVMAALEGPEPSTELPVAATKALAELNR